MNEQEIDAYNNGYAIAKQESDRLRKLLQEALDALEETGIRWPFINQTIQNIKKELRP